jgi:trk system potassium uptake protein TrkH
MFIGAISFVTHNKIFSGHLSVLLSQEFLLYVSLIVIGVALITFLGHDEFHNTLLNTVSAIACGGFAIGDLSVLHEFSIYVLVILMVCGGMYGSTTGGIKLWRILVALKVIWSRIRAYFVPSGTVQIITLDKNPVSQEAITEVLGFIFLYLAIFLICAGVFMAWDFGIVDSMFTVASALGNVGLSTIDIYALPDYSKAFLVFMMYIGRIEILPVLAMIRFMFGRK